MLSSFSVTKARIGQTGLGLKTFIAAAAASLAFGGHWAPAHAADVAWTGAGSDSFWSTANNWSTAAVPGAGDNLRFGPGASRLQNSVNVSTVFGNISFLAGADTYLIDQGGRDFTVGGDIFANAGAGTTNKIKAKVIFTNTTNHYIQVDSGTLDFFDPSAFPNVGQGITLPGAGLSLTISSSASGSGRVLLGDLCCGANRLFISGPVTVETYVTWLADMPITVGGTLITHPGAGYATNKSIEVQPNGTLVLENNTHFGPLTVESPSAPYSGGTLELRRSSTAAGDAWTYDIVFLRPGSTLRYRIGSTTSYTRLEQRTVCSITATGVNLDLVFSTPSTTGDAFPLLICDGSVAPSIAGTFSGLPEGANFTRNGRIYRINYNVSRTTPIVVTDIGAAPAPPSAGSTPIPTLSHWGLLALSGLIMCVGLLLARRAAMPSEPNGRD